MKLKKILCFYILIYSSHKALRGYEDRILNCIAKRSSKNRQFVTVFSVGPDSATLSIPSIRIIFWTITQLISHDTDFDGVFNDKKTKTVKEQNLPLRLSVMLWHPYCKDRNLWRYWCCPKGEGEKTSFWLILPNLKFLPVYSPIVGNSRHLRIECTMFTVYPCKESKNTHYFVAAFPSQNHHGYKH